DDAGTRPAVAAWRRQAAPFPGLFRAGGERGAAVRALAGAAGRGAGAGAPGHRPGVRTGRADRYPALRSHGRAGQHPGRDRRPRHAAHAAPGPALQDRGAAVSPDPGLTGPALRSVRAAAIAAMRASRRAAPNAGPSWQIGRASCREGGEVKVAAGTIATEI